MTNSNLSPPAPIILPSTLRLSLSNGRPQRVIPSFLPQTSPCTTHHSAKQRYVNEITETIGGSPRPSPVLLQYVPVLGGAAAAAPLFHKLDGGVEEEALFSILTASLISSRLRQQKPPPPAEGAKDGGGGGGESPSGGGKWKRNRILRTLLPEEQWLCQRKSVVLHRTHKTAVPVVVKRNANSCNEEGRIPHLL